MFQVIAFIIALVAGLYKLLKEETISYTYIIVVTLFSGFVSLIIAFFGGFLFPAEALTITTQAQFISVLLEHFFYAFIGAIVSPIVKFIAKIKLS